MVNREEIEKYTTSLINKSILTDEEKWYWLDILSKMTNEQIRKLNSILILDKDIKGFNETYLINYEERK